MVETHPLGNFIPKNAKYLVLGSFAAKAFGVAEGYDWYYSSKVNQFWPILEQVYGVELRIKEAKQKLFIKLGIAIADIIYQCERKKFSSLDNQLINIVYNPELENLIRDNRIQKVFFSSKFVEKEFRKHFKNIIAEFPQLELVTLPSPSPRYAQMTKVQKIEKYRELLPRNSD